MEDKIETTGSRAQDALKVGYQTTCNEGLGVLCKLEDLTIEACKDFRPRAIKDAEQAIEIYKDQNKKPRVAYHKEQKLGWTLKEIILRIKIKIGVEFPERVAVVETPKEKEFYHGEPELNTKEGRYETIIFEKGVEKDYVKDKIYTSAKLGTLQLDHFDEYNERIIPDGCIEEIKRAKKIGLENIKIAYPKIKDGSVPNRDPIIVGYIAEQMYMITRFNTGEPEENL